MQATVLRARHAVPAALIATMVGLSGCGSDNGAGDPPGDPRAALEQAAELLDTAESVHFTVEGENLPGSGTVIVGAEGVAVPPASFDGGVRIRAGALPATIEVISIDGRLWAQLPLTDHYEQVDAADLEIGDPAKLIDPDEGVSLLLKSGTDVDSADRVRVDGEVYDQVRSVLPGDLVGAILAIADPDADVDVVWALDPSSGHLRQATLTGPFYPDGVQTYTVSLDRYDDPAEISAPAG